MRTFRHGRAALKRSSERPRSSKELRRLAELRLASSPPQGEHDGDPARLNHELRVHQVELEVQNEELREAQIELVASRDRYQALFARAPFGYVTVEDDGKIVEANQTATNLLRMKRQQLVGLRLSALMDERDADQF